MYVEGYVLDAENSDIIHILTEGDNDLVVRFKIDKNGDGIPDEDQDLNKPEDSDFNKDSEKADGEDTAAATNVGIFASLATSALAGLGILTALKKRRKN